MDVVNRIDWRRGMPIGAKVFIDADNYHIFTNKIARHLAAPMAYGLVPESQWVLETTISQDQLSIDKVAMVFIDKAGRIMQLDKGGEVSLRGLPQGVFYLAVSLVEEKHKETNGVPYLDQIFKYQVINLLEPENEVLFPVLKIQHEHDGWKVCDFIPPCCCVCSHPTLLILAKQCQQIVQQMLKVAEEKGMQQVEYEIGSLCIEWANSIATETAVEFIAQLKKIIFLMKPHPLFEQKDAVSEERIKSFIWNAYNPNMLLETIQEALSILTAVVDSMKVEPPKPAPVQENKVEEEEYYIL